MTYREFLETKIEIAHKSGFPIDESEINPRLLPHQRDAVKWAVEGGCRALFESFGLGKCHGKGTMILMYDCSVKAVEDIQVGDKIMGDDGTPRTVLSLARGTDEMYKVTLKNGDSFTCNSAHILSCEMSNHYREHKTGEIVNIPITEYMKLPEYAKSNCFKAYKRGLEFEHKDVKFDPYIYGVWLGDGCSKELKFTINDRDTEIVECLYKWAESNCLNVRTVEEKRGCKTYCLYKTTENNQPYFERSFVKKAAKGGKHIFKDYLVNDRQTRLQVLAGLLDTDGYLVDNCYEIVTKFSRLRDDILFLCRSLGLSVTHAIKVVNNKEYYRIWISGNTAKIPCITRKKASERKQIKNPLRYGFKVEPIGEGEYYGFMLDGNHLYMLEDFTVTHNTVQELEWCRIITEKQGGQALIIMPLGVKQEFQRDAVELLGMSKPPYVRNMAEIREHSEPILITNYERVRDGDIDVNYFTAIALDEAAVLRTFGSKTYQTFLTRFKNVKYKLVATATPSPNKYEELIHYSNFLGVMDSGQAIARFFKRDGAKMNNMTIYPNRESDFWLWVSSWALYVTTPSDLGYDDTGYDLPPMQVNWHRIKVNSGVVTDMDGQVQFEREAALSLRDAAAAKRESIEDRVAFAKKIVDENPDDHFILWHDLEAERHAIKKAIPEAVEIFGSQPVEVKEQRTIDFAEGKCRILATKKEISGSGCNFQRHCHRAIFVGIDYEFNDFIQAIHRIYRFLQTENVVIDVIYTNEEDEILAALKRKWKQHDYMISKMKGIMREYGLSGIARIDKLSRQIGVKRVVVQGEHYKAINNDCVEETKNMADNSIGLICTSIPFSKQFEYTPSYNDFGHNENTDRFFEQMNYLTPELLRILKPGRIFACHVKDLVISSTVNGLGMQTIEPFHAKCIEHYMSHGFIYFGMITVCVDVVRENNKTYRLGWTEQCKDGTKMGVGVPEYILLFRKAPTDLSNSYADEPVTKDKAEYTRGQWQLDAHAYWRSSGDLLLDKEEIKRIPASQLQKVYSKFSKSTVYDYEEHVKLANELDRENKLPATFMCLAPSSWTDEVWDDINRTRTLNSEQARRNEQTHICPFPIDIVERILTRYSNKGDVVLDPFGGLMTVPMTAVKMGRYGIGIELNPDYFRDGIGYLKAAEDEIDTPTLFDYLEEIS